MEDHISIQELWQPVRAKLPMLLIVSVIAAMLVYGILTRLKPVYEVHYSYIVSLSARDTTPDFRFDGYYALQATDLFTATLASWATTPETIVAAYNEAGITLPSQNPRNLGKAVRAEKTAPQLVQVTVSDESKVNAEDLAAALQVVMKKNVDAYQAQGIPAVTFKVVATQPWTGLVAISKLVIVVAIFAFVLFFGVNGVLLYESFRRDA